MTFQNSRSYQWTLDLFKLGTKSSFNVKTMEITSDYSLLMLNTLYSLIWTGKGTIRAFPHRPNLISCPVGPIIAMHELEKKFIFMLQIHNFRPRAREARGFGYLLSSWRSEYAETGEVVLLLGLDVAPQPPCLFWTRDEKQNRQKPYCYIQLVSGK